MAEVLTLTKKNKPDEDNDQCKKKHEDGNAVDAMHVFYPAVAGGAWIFLFQVEVFCQLPEHTHGGNFEVRIFNVPGFGLFVVTSKPL